MAGEFVCSHWDEKRRTCTFNKRAAMEFLNSVGAVVKDGEKRPSVDPSAEWSQEDWQRYNSMMATLATGIGGLNLPTGKISCGEGDQGINPFCEQWDCEGKAKYEELKAANPSSLIIIRRNQISL